MEIDYRVLLKKYMKLITDKEGIDYVSSAPNAYSRDYVGIATEVYYQAGYTGTFVRTEGSYKMAEIFKTTIVDRFASEAEIMKNKGKILRVWIPIIAGDKLTNYDFELEVVDIKRIRAKMRF